MSEQIPDDQELLQRHLDGDEAAFTALVERHRQLVWGMSRALTDEGAADDCCQAVFLLLDRKAKRLRGSNKPLADWLLACVRRVAANHRRAEDRRRRREAAAAIPSPSGQPASELPTDLLLNAIEDLPASLREAVVIHHLEGLGRPQVAERLGCSLEAIDKRLQRALSTLREALSRRGYGAALSAALCSLGLLRQAEAATPTAVICGGVAAPSATVTALAKGGFAMGSIATVCLSLVSVVTIFAAVQAEPAPLPPVDDEPTRVEQVASSSDAVVHIYRAALLYAHDEQKAEAVGQAIEGYERGEPFGDKQARWFDDDAMTWHQQVLHELALAAACTDCRWNRDLAFVGPGTLMPEMVSVRQAALLNLLRARWRQEHGDFAAAAEDCLTVIALGRHWQRDNILISALVGISIETKAMVTMLELSAEWPEGLKLSIGARLTNVPVAPAPSQWLRGERAMLDWFEGQLAGKSATEVMTILGQSGIDIKDMGLRDGLAISMPETRKDLFAKARPYYEELGRIMDLPPEAAKAQMPALEKQIQDITLLAFFAPAVQRSKDSHTAVVCLRSYLQACLLGERIDAAYSFEITGGELILRWPAIGLEQRWEIKVQAAPLGDDGKIEF